jgi:drug/metabolite transporter (DMT)-like permease
LIRALIIVGIQICIIKGYYFASKAQLNNGIITTLFSLVCVFSAIFSYILFNEKLRINHIIGMVCTFSCVSFIAYPDEASPYKAKFILKNIEFHSDYATALLYGVFTPFLLALAIIFTKYWSRTFNYDSKTFTVDTLLIVALIYMPFFVEYQQTKGYSMYQITFGVLAAIANCVGTICLNYATTEGLAGPASAMIQCQGLIHVILSSYF